MNLFGFYISPKAGPVLLIAINLFSALVCFKAGDIRRGIYWCAAATLNATITF